MVDEFLTVPEVVFTAKELAASWNWSERQVVRIFEEEVGVMVERYKRTRTMTIPLSAVLRVHAALVSVSSAGLTVDHRGVPMPRPSPYIGCIYVGNGAYTIVDYLDLVEPLRGWAWRTHGKPPHLYAARSTTARERLAGAPAYIPMHHVILGLAPGERGDHINGNTLDNRRANLRRATVTQNNMNRRMRKDNASGFKGVGFHKQKQRWTAEIMANGKRYKLGYFRSPEDAHAAYCEAAKRLHGEFARLA